MAVEHAILRVETPSSTGTVSYTDSAITDWKCALFFLSGATADATNTAHAKLMVGTCDSDGGQWVSAPRATDGLSNPSNSNTRTRLSDENCIALIDDNANTLTGEGVEAEFSAALSNGVTLNWTEVNTTGLNLTILLLGGDINAHADTVGNVGASSSVTDPGFEPDLVIGVSGSGTINPGATNTHFVGSLGFAVNDGSESQASYAAYWAFGADPTNCDAIIHTDVVGGFHTGAADVEINLTSFDVNGFTLSASGSLPEFLYLAIEFTDGQTTAQVASETLPGSTGTTDFTGVGVFPRFCIGVYGLVASDDAGVDGALAGNIGFGVFDSSTEYAHAASNEADVDLGPGMSSTNALSYTDDQALSLLDDGGTLAVDANVSAFLSNGVRLNFDTATAGRMVLLAVELPDVLVQGDETENILDSARLVTGNKAVLAETENILDSVAMAKGVALPTETVHILDEALVQATTVVRVAVKEFGAVTSSTPENGRIISGGPVAGRIK